jgi:hypothetical protein
LIAPLPLTPDSVGVPSPQFQVYVIGISPVTVAVKTITSPRPTGLSETRLVTVGAVQAVATVVVNVLASLTVGEFSDVAVTVATLCCPPLAVGGMTTETITDVVPLGGSMSVIEGTTVVAHGSPTVDSPRPKLSGTSPVFVSVSV